MSLTRPRPNCAAVPESCKSSETFTRVPCGEAVSVAIKTATASPRPLRSAPDASRVRIFLALSRLLTLAAPSNSHFTGPAEIITPPL